MEQAGDRRARCLHLASQTSDLPRRKMAPGAFLTQNFPRSVALQYKMSIMVVVKSLSDSISSPALSIFLIYHGTIRQGVLYDHNIRRPLKVVAGVFRSFETGLRLQRAQKNVQRSSLCYPDMPYRIRARSSTSLQSHQV